MSKAGLYISAEATAVQGPRGLSIKEFKFKETLSNGDNVYQVILENNTIIGELTARKGDKGDIGAKGETGNGIKIVEKIGEENKTKRYRMTFTNGQEFDWSTEDGDTAYEVAVDNGFEGTEAEWLESLIGKGLEFEWKGTQLGVKVEGETNYKYVDLKGERGKNIEFTWRGTELGVRIEGQTSYQYVNLKGEKGNSGADGVGIKDITFKETDSNGGNVYTITLTNGNTYEFTAPKGDGNSGISQDDIIDNVTTDDAAKALSARQGKVLNETKMDRKPILIGNTQTETNLNDIKTPGIYASASDSNLIAGLPGNFGTKRAFELVVLSIDHGENYACQYLRRYSDDAIWLRNFDIYRKGNGWSGWTKIITSSGATFNGKVRANKGFAVNNVECSGGISANGITVNNVECNSQMYVNGHGGFNGSTTFNNGVTANNPVSVNNTLTVNKLMINGYEIVIE